MTATTETSAARRRRRTPNPAVTAMADAMTRRARQDHEHELLAVRGRVGDREQRIASLGDQLRRLHAAQGPDRARLSELESAPVLPDLDAAAAEIRFIRGLPGVTRVWVDHRGRLVVSFKTACMYKGRKYHMGDFDLVMPWMARAEAVFELVCTRSGVLKIQSPNIDHAWGCSRRNCNCPRERYASHLYWGGSARDGTGHGDFCFGSGDRYHQIHALWRDRRYGEFVHLVIATMCLVNDGDWDMVPKIFRSSRLSPKRQAAWRHGQPPEHVETII